MYQKQAWQTALWVLSVQLILIFVMMMLWFMFQNGSSALAAGYGGLISLIPATIMAKMMTSGGPGKTPSEFVSRMYAGGAIKFMLASAMFALAAWKFSELFLQVVTTYLVAQASYFWVALRFTKNR